MHDEGARDLIRAQADAIREAADRLDLDELSRAVKLVCDCRGKVITSGAGTSGLIARKLAATFTSTGTASVFLHPGDALHGALGIVTGDDVGILVSNSGETDEMLALLPYLEQRQVPLIAIVGNLSSTLSRRSQATLDATVARETCPLNLAPTSSTSVALAVGDALAMTVMAAKEISAESFARNHPSGRLGKRLTLRVDDLMDGGPRRPVVRPEASWIEVVTTITDGGLGAVTVEDGEHVLLGIVTDGDLRRALQRVGTGGLDRLRASEIMTAEPVWVRLGVLAYDALTLMENRPSQISIVPVLDASNRCVGLVRLHDLVRAGI